MAAGIAARPALAEDQVIRFENVSRFYGDVLGVNRVNLTIGPGVTSLVGPNGSGKSTLMNLMTGLIRPSRGRLRVLGLSPSDPERFFRLVGYCAQFDHFPRGVTGRSFIRDSLLLQGLTRDEAAQRTSEALDRVNMTEAADRKLAGHSKGMRQRIRLAQAIAHHPQVLVLDEPLNGLDPMARAETMSLLKALADDGKHVIISSHILHEVDRLSDQVVLLSHGYVVAEGQIHGVRDEVRDQPAQILVRCSDPAPAGAPGLRRRRAWSRPASRTTARALLVRTRDADRFYRLLNRAVAAGEIELEAVAPADDDVGSVYQYLLGNDGAGWLSHETSQACPASPAPPPAGHHPPPRAGQEPAQLARAVAVSAGPAAAAPHRPAHPGRPAPERRRPPRAGPRHHRSWPAIFQFYYLRLGIFFGCLGLFTRLFRGEMMERSLHHYLLAPVRRELLTIGKFLAGLIISVATFGTAVLLAFVLMYLHFGAEARSFVLSGPGLGHLGSYLLVTALACLGYGSLFLLVGLLARNPILPAVPILIWESMNHILPASLKFLSVIFYLEPLLPVEVPAQQRAAHLLRHPRRPGGLLHRRCPAWSWSAPPSCWPPASARAARRSTTRSSAGTRGSEGVNATRAMRALLWPASQS